MKVWVLIEDWGYNERDSQPILGIYETEEQAEEERLALSLPVNAHIESFDVQRKSK